MKKIFFYSLLCLFITGCAQSSSVLKMGPDTYTVSIHAAPLRGGETGAKALALKQASEHCSSIQRELLVNNISVKPSSHLPGGTADLIFRCLSLNDSELIRPSYEKSPDILIKN